MDTRPRDPEAKLAQVQEELAKVQVHKNVLVQETKDLHVQLEEVQVKFEDVQHELEVTRKEKEAIEKEKEMAQRNIVKKEKENEDLLERLDIAQQKLREEGVKPSARVLMDEVKELKEQIEQLIATRNEGEASYKQQIAEREQLLSKVQLELTQERAEKAKINTELETANFTKQQLQKQILEMQVPFFGEKGVDYECITLYNRLLCSP